jgi:hypothetical protein
MGRDHRRAAGAEVVWVVEAVVAGAAGQVLGRGASVFAPDAEPKCHTNEVSRASR